MPNDATGENIILTGFMGTGKSTVGRIVADILDYDFLDTDSVVESRYGTVSEIFAEHGESGFRELEHKVAMDLADRTGLVIATGGGLMLNPDNVAVLSASGRVFCLVADPEEIYRRLANSRKERPLIQVENPRERINELLAERQERYDQFPQIETDGRTQEEVADEIARRMTEPPLDGLGEVQTAPGLPGTAGGPGEVAEAVGEKIRQVKEKFTKPKK